MTLYTLGKELVKTFDEGTKSAATVHAQSWAGVNDSGDTVASGIYLIHIEAPGFKDTKKIAVVK